ncbi:MAG: hypothetical protein HY363_05670 [Candidatus Aenigmarchaeota archaeon]|nr:hypothetical protein [Candidatus Aenigmarchaeota archaeon]
MTKPISLALSEVKSALKQMVLFNSIMDSLAVFLISVLVFILVSLQWYYAFIPFLLYAGLHTYRAIKGTSYRQVEDKVPQLKEMLRTAADNVSRDNEITGALNQDVLHLMKLVRTSYFLNFGRLTRELLMMGVVAFLIIGASAYNVHLLNFDEVASKIKSSYGGFGQYEMSSEDLVYEENASDDIYGNKSVAELGSEELNLQINPVLSDVAIGKTKPPEKKEFQEVPPREIAGTTDTTFQETIPKGYQKIVKSYFREIAKG